MEQEYTKHLDDLIVVISITNVVTITDTFSKITAKVQLASDDEAKALIKEVEDIHGELMYEDGAIFSKYTELHQFRP